MNEALLKKRLNRLYATYNRNFLYSDPVQFVHRYPDAADKEVVALICSSLAYGHVKMIQRNLERALAILGPHPAQFVRNLDPADAFTTFADFSHRFTKGKDIVHLLHYMKQMIESADSIGGFFESGYNHDDEHIGPSLATFVERVLALDCSPVYPDGALPNDAGVRFFFPSPLNGSACKRLNLFLRWMIRPADGVDFGLWRFASPSQLIIPLDTHVCRICGLLGLTNLRSPGWAMAVDITRNLKRLDPRDPVKYDFAISRLGILSECPRIPLEDNCARCSIGSLCRMQNHPVTKTGTISRI